MITIINYGLGNIKAFCNVYYRLNIPFKVAYTEKDLDNTSKIILPGVGSFDHAMTLLQNSGMREKLDELVLSNKVPVLGICVGMQILAKSSEEGELPGLGWINAKVVKFDSNKLPFKTHLPHMGWNVVNPSSSPLFEGIERESRFYFLHSYYFQCNEAYSISYTDYGIQFTSAVKFNNIYGVQFHPEKSHYKGENILKNFAIL